MQGYVAAALNKYQYKLEQRPQHSPHKWYRPRYGARQQIARKEYTSPLLTKEEKTHIQPIVVVFLYYARSVDPKVLVALGSISTNQYNINETTAQAIKQLLYYCIQHPDATIIYKQRHMALNVNSNVS